MMTRARFKYLVSEASDWTALGLALFGVLFFFLLWRRAPLIIVILLVYYLFFHGSPR